MAENIGGGGTSRGLVVVLMFLLFLSSCTCRSTVVNEFELLLSIKSSMRDPLRALPNWNVSLPFCQWQGIACDNSSHVTKIELSGKNLSGKIIPESLFHFPYVEIVDLSSNLLSGDEIVLSIGISSSSSLRYLNLSNNNFTGPPLSYKAWNSGLQVLDLSNNMLSGEISDSIGLFSGLKHLDLGGNVLEGRIPNSISNLTGLESLTLASNQLVGEIPPELGRLKGLKWIYLGYNHLTGGIPVEFGELTSLNHLDLVYNNLTGEIPFSLGNLTHLQYLFLYLNKLTGPIPPSIFRLEKLISLDLSDNFLSGEIPEIVIQLQNLEVLHLFSNNFSGKIPNSLTFLPNLQVLQLWSNQLSGDIPEYLGKRNNLTVLDLSTNNLTGKIPQGLCESGQLFKLILFSNSLEGEIPTALSRCKSLKRLRIQNNRLSGELPPEFTKLPLVYFFDVSNNSLSGTISGSRSRWSMPELQMLNLATNRFSGHLPDSFGSDMLENLDLSENHFSGEIPVSFGGFSELMQLKMSENELTGKIPPELASCEKLVTLDLSHNQLTGPIPSSLGEMPVLGQLDLSANQLSGEIPRNLGKVESLVQVNISHNHFRGNLPSTGAFLAINSTAVAGNHLCGRDTTAGLPPCRSGKTPVWWFYLSLLLAVLAVLAVAGFTIFFLRRRKGLEFLKKVENEDGWELHFFHSRTSKDVKVDDILCSMRDENVISRGRRGVTYKGKSFNSSIQFVVKEIISAPACFWDEAAELGKLHHPNIVKVIAMSRSKKAGGFIVYEYVEGKSLSEVFRGMSLERRRKVALGVVRAVRYLHSCRSTGLLLGSDIAPDRIIVDGKDEPHLRLTQLPWIVSTDTKSFTSSPYVAPESKETKDITEKSDIYGFGLILVELLTGKSPADNHELGDHESIVEWARYCYSDCHLDVWVDPTIRGQASNNQNEIVEAMNLALQCTAGDPTARPCASDVVKSLESVIRPRSCVLALNCSSAV